MARMNVYLALLRGINVGGKNVIPMADLRDAFAELGFEDVRTYIQSGNVLFRAPSADEGRIETGLRERFDYHGRLLVMSRRRYLASVAQAPDWWGDTDTHRHNALFTLAGTTPARVLRALPPPSEYETIATAPGVIFWSGLKERLTRTMFVSKLAGHPAYQELTVRNSRTTHKLEALLGEM
ncbi:MAG: DUF1697 domain-containing protein [Acidimicrobiia bacterium]|nr:DUF1697 domain-containing protein [Acidimicrobiia bacterium]